MPSAKFFRLLECFSIFVFLPMALWYLGVATGGIFLFLWVLMIACLFVYARSDGNKTEILNLSACNWKNMRPILQRFVLVAPLLVLFLFLYNPEKLFSFPREKPGLWVLVMFLYPLLSALPQEIIYRLFFFHRYEKYFGTQAFLLLNGVCFGLAHAVFDNWIAISFSAVGGIFFAQTYAKTRSLALVTIEHAIYGNFLFTVGLGWYFYHGNIQ